MLEHLPWILAGLSVALLLAAAGLWWRHGRAVRAHPLPTEWTLSPRPVFSQDERRVYRQLREALPHHVVLAKLPLVRFTQPNDPQEVRYWYELLGSTHVSFAICSGNGRVLAAIDLDPDRGPPRRPQQIKRSVLAACRIRYLRCDPDTLPSIPELQLLVPQSFAASRGPHPAPATAMPGHAGLGEIDPAIHRTRGRAPLWQDSGFFQDSFFGAEARADFSFSSYGSDAFAPPRPPLRGGPPDDGGGVVVETPPSPLRH
jgi:hypothetical protein